MNQHIEPEAKSEVIYQSPETQYKSNVVCWLYLTNDKILHYRRNEPGIEWKIRRAANVGRVWSWDGSWSKAWEILIEALASGASRWYVFAMAKMWGFNNCDAKFFAFNKGVLLGEDGDLLTATRLDFVDLQESPAGFGVSYLEAMASLCKELGYNGSIGFVDLLKSPVSIPAK